MSEVILAIDLDLLSKTRVSNYNLSSMKQRGFSIIDLMITVSIISILASIAVPSYQAFQKKAKQAHAKSALGDLHQFEKVFHQEYNSYSARLDQLGYSPEGKMYYVIGFNTDFVFVPPDGGPTGSATCNFTCGGYAGLPLCNFPMNWTCSPESCFGKENSVATFASATTYLAMAHAHLDEMTCGTPMSTTTGIDTWMIDQNGRRSSLANPD